jgi:hypothetical protein
MHDAPTANFTFAAMLGRTALTSESRAAANSFADGTSVASTT